MLIYSLIILNYFRTLVILPAVAEAWSPFWLFNIPWGAYLLYNISYFYYKAVTTPPGSPSDLVMVNGGAGILDVERRTCKKCSFTKPRRTHHCSACRQCVLKMDHHCPWLNNCVGFFNYR